MLSAVRDLLPKKYQIKMELLMKTKKFLALTSKTGSLQIEVLLIILAFYKGQELSIAHTALLVQQILLEIVQI